MRLRLRGEAGLCNHVASDEPALQQQHDVVCPDIAERCLGAGSLQAFIAVKNSKFAAYLVAFSTARLVVLQARPSQTRGQRERVIPSGVSVVSVVRHLHSRTPCTATVTIGGGRARESACG